MSNEEVGTAWRRISDRIVAGLAHDLNGRVTAFDGLLRIHDMEPQSPNWLSGHLRTEVDKLDKTVRLLRSLPRAYRQEDAEALQLAEIALLAVELCSCAVDIDREGLRITVSQRPVLRAPHDALLELLILCIGAFTSMEERASNVAVVVDQTSAGEARLTVHCTTCSPDPLLLGAGHAVAEKLGGTIQVYDDGCEVVLPTLRRSR
jgi:hypothetical protein